MLAPVVNVLPKCVAPVPPTEPVETKLPPFTLPDALNVVYTPRPPPILPTFALPVTDNAPAVTKLPPVMLPVATINQPVPMLPTLALPETLSDASVPTAVILDCAPV